MSKKNPTTTCPTCPTCNQPLPQERAERLTKALVKALAEIAAAGGEFGYVDVPAYRYRGTHAKLKYWTFLEEETFSADPHHLQRRSGRWRVTPLGLKFLQGKVRPPEIAIVLQDQVVRYEGARLRWTGAELVEVPEPVPPSPEQDQKTKAMLEAILAKE